MVSCWYLCTGILRYFVVFPDEGYYQSGKFYFEIDVPEAYNMVVSDLFVCSVCCLYLFPLLFLSCLAVL